MTSPQTAYLITSMLEGVIQNGTGRSVQSIGRPAAGKTGTTNDQHDAWFVGYTPDLLTGVWVGYDDHRSLGAEGTGGKVAAPIWLDFMKQAVADQPARAFTIPDGITCVLIDKTTGLRARLDDLDAPLECFLDGTEPRSFAPTWESDSAFGADTVVTGQEPVAEPSGEPRSHMAPSVPVEAAPIPTSRRLSRYSSSSRERSAPRDPRH